MPRWLVLGFQDRGSPAIVELFCLHDYVMVIILRVIVLITYIVIYLLFGFYYYKFLSEGTFIETIWSLVPAFLLILLLLPSIKVLYIVEDTKFPIFSFKIVAHQWYWTYIVPLFKNFSYIINSHENSFYEFDSLIESVFNTPRLLRSSSDLFLPLFVSSRLLISSTDVIHSFSLPSLGLKVDALPGRINQLFCSPLLLGSFFGQCSEICGSNHSFMPIRVKVCNLKEFDELRKFYFFDLVEELFSVNF